MTDSILFVLIGLFVFVTICTVILYYIVYKQAINKSYWRGRMAGWQACENMVITRAKERGWTIWEDLLQ